MAHIGGLHYILVGQPCLSLGRAGRKPLDPRALAQAATRFTEREAQAGEGHGALEISQLFGGIAAPPPRRDGGGPSCFFPLLGGEDQIPGVTANACSQLC